MQLGKTRTVGGGDEIKYWLPDRLFKRVSLDHRQPGRVHLDQASPRIKDHDAFRFGFDDGVHPGFGFDQCPSGLV